MTSKTVETQEEMKKEMGNYPYFPLSSALKVSDAIKELGGARSNIPKPVLAKHLKESEKSATFSQRITSAKAFGLIFGRRGEYGLTELAKKYYFPTGESDKSAALLEIFACPIAFGELLHRFDGDTLPSREILGNILHRELNVPESWKDRVASFFANSAQFVGAIDERGFLRHRASFHKSSPVESNEVPTNDAPRPESRVRFYGGGPSIPINNEKASSSNIWSFSHGGKSVRLETPIDLDKQLWEKLNAYVQLLKPIGVDMPGSI